MEENTILPKTASSFLRMPTSLENGRMRRRTRGSGEVTINKVKFEGVVGVETLVI